MRETTSIRLSRAERRVLASAAKREGKPLSNWMREKLLAASAQPNGKEKK